jgi:uncharacterized DUF497 family protein
VRISYDPKKRSKTLDERGLDFEDAIYVFEDPLSEVEDKRKDYRERRVVCYGYLDRRLLVVCYTERHGVRHIISMRKANDREQKKVHEKVRL